MYKIFGADGMEYGPYSVEDLRKLVLERRANASTLAKPETGGEWRALSEYPEFAEALQQAATMSPVPSAENLRMNEVISESWRLFTTRPGLLIGANFVVLLIAVGVHVVPVLGSIAMFVFVGPLFSGCSLLSLKLARNEPATFEDAFAGFRIQFLALTLCGVVYQLLVSLGLILLIIPGVYLAVAWSLSFLLIVDRRMEFWEAMELSRKTINQKWFWFFGLFLIALILFMLGSLLCGIGLIFTLPLMNNLFAAAYRRIFAG